MRFNRRCLFIVFRWMSLYLLRLRIKIVIALRKAVGGLLQALLQSGGTISGWRHRNNFVSCCLFHIASNTSSARRVLFRMRGFATATLLAPIGRRVFLVLVGFKFVITRFILLNFFTDYRKRFTEIIYKGYIYNLLPSIRNAYLF